MAGYYEENLLIMDALTAYQQAIKLAPDVSVYSESYTEFLKRLGFEIK
jgi:cytochrome c-type biogenesis protein CcmH/NrfG